MSVYCAVCVSDLMCVTLFSSSEKCQCTMGMCKWFEETAGLWCAFVGMFSSSKECQCSMWYVCMLQSGLYNWVLHDCMYRDSNMTAKDCVSRAVWWVRDLYASSWIDDFVLVYLWDMKVKSAEDLPWLLVDSKPIIINCCGTKHCLLIGQLPFAWFAQDTGIQLVAKPWCCVYLLSIVCIQAYDHINGSVAGLSVYWIDWWLKLVEQASLPTF